jgi:hypothetical protein
VLVDLNEDRPIGIFEYARLKIYISELLAGAGDVVNRRTLKPLLRDNILREAVHAFGCATFILSGETLDPSGVRLEARK